jgi:hypothetical protein
LDSALAFLAPGGPAGEHSFWMQPPSNDCPRFFSTRLLGRLLRDWKMLRLLRMYLIFRWLIFVSTLGDP